MRIVVVIISLAAIALGLVHIRRAEMSVQYELQRVRTEQVELRRRLWDQQVRMGLLTAPDEVRRRAEDMSLGLTHRTGAQRQHAIRPEYGNR